jgi:hypothetical protein
MLEWLCLIGVEQRSSYPQTRQSVVAAITWDLKTSFLCDSGALGTPRPKGTVPAWAAAWLRDYDTGCWYEAYCNPAPWRWRNGNCKRHSFRYEGASWHLIYIGTVVVVRHVNLSCNHTIVWIGSKQSVRYVGSCPDYRTIWERDV